MSKKFPINSRLEEFYKPAKPANRKGYQGYESILLSQLAALVQHHHEQRPENPQSREPSAQRYCGTGYLFHKMPHFPGKWSGNLYLGKGIRIVGVELAKLLNPVVRPSIGRFNI